MKVGEILKEYRERNEVSMNQFAMRSGISKPYVSMLEKGINPATGKEITPGLDTLNKIAYGMGISLDDLLGMMDGNQTVSLTNAPEGYALLDKEDKKRVQAFVNYLLASKL